MLLKHDLLKSIAAGRVSTVFRRWRRPGVRAGGTLRTVAGVLAIDAVDPVDPARITSADAARAGFASLESLRADLSAQRPGTVYRIRVRLAGPDPRIALRSKSKLSANELAELKRRLDRLDAASRHGPWTIRFLELIRANPNCRAGELAPLVGREKESFKLDMRKLKNLGLTQSLHPGYRISPRGLSLLRRNGEQ